MASMSSEYQARMLTPSIMFRRNDLGIPPMFKPRPSSRGCCSKCPVHLLTAFVALSVIALAFSLIVLRPTNPEFGLRDMSVRFLNYTNGYPAPWLNATFAARASLKNTNFGRFEFKNSNLTVTYNGTVIGETALGNGTVWPRERKYLDFAVVVGSSRLSDLKNLSSDMSDNVLELMSYAELRGTVHLIKIVKRKLTSVMNCTMSLDLSKRRVQDLICK